MAGLDNTPAELLSWIFDNLTLTDLDALEKAWKNHQLRYAIGDLFLRRVVKSRNNPLLELVQLERVSEIDLLASQSAVVDVNVSDEAGQAPLNLAAKRGCVPVVRALLQFPDINVNRGDCLGRSALVSAAQNGHLETAELLLCHGAAIDSPTDRGETAAAWAARNGHLDVLSLLVSNRSDTLSTDAEGWRGLDWAIMQGHTEVAEYLLLHHNHFAGDRVQQNKVLLLAAESGNETAIRRILTAGAEIDCRDEQESTPLHLAVSFGHQRTVELLLDSGADPNLRDMYGNAPLHWAIIYPAIMKLLISKISTADTRGTRGKTSLMCCVLAGQEETTLILLNSGKANVEIQDDYGCTALHGAAAKGSKSLALALLKKGANVMVADMDGWTAFDFAMVNGHLTVMNMLRDEMGNEGGTSHLGLDILQNYDTRCILEEMSRRKSNGSDGVTGLRSAVNCRHFHRLLTMLDTGLGIDEVDPVGGATALTLAAWFNEGDTVKLLLDSGAAIDAKDGSGRTALHVAVEGGYCDLVAMLVDRGANVETEFSSWTPLLLAAKRLWDDEVGPWMVDYLASKTRGANIRAKDYYGRGVLHWCAVYGGEQSLINLLDLDSFLVSIKDHFGQSSLHFAIAAHRADLVQVLLQQDMRLASWKSCDGLTPVHIAAYTGQLNILTLLVDIGKCSHEPRETNHPNQGTHHVIYPPELELDLGAKDVDGYTALTLALLTGNLHVVQFLRRLPEGDKGDFQYPNSVTYPVLSALRPPLLQLPAREESINLRNVRYGSCPQKPLFSTAVRKWLQDQCRTVLSRHEKP